MKRIFSLAYTILLCAVTLYAEDYRTETIAPGLTITAHENGYKIRYWIPSFSEEIVEVDEGLFFSVIVFDDDYDFLDVGYEGQPALPVKTLLLQLPDEATEAGLEVLEYTGTYKELTLSYPYLPEPYDFMESDSSDYWFQYDTVFYQTADKCGYQVDGVEMSDIFHTLGTTGLAVNFTPVTYFPQSNKVIVPVEIVFDVRVDNLFSLCGLHEDCWYDFDWSDCTPGALPPHGTGLPATHLRQGIGVSPTVADDCTVVSIGVDVCADIDIYDLGGILVSSNHGVSGNVPIATSDFAEGCYLVAVSVDGRIVAREKIFVKH